MLKTLGLHAIGLPGWSIPDAVDIASEFRFDAITFDIREASAIAAAQGTAGLNSIFTAKGIKPASWNLPVAYRDDAKYQDDLAALPALAALGVEMGSLRVTTGVMPGSDDLTYDENFAYTVDRLRPAAEILKSAGCALGIEFIGPKTLRSRFKHEFVYTLDGILEIADAIGTGNVGILLDIWHQYTAGGQIDQIDGLTKEQVIAVHVNDAPVGIDRDDQLDNVRALPLETGVLDNVNFLKKLNAIGYDGPVMPEPFSARVEAMAAKDAKSAVRATGESMDALWKAAGF